MLKNLLSFAIILGIVGLVVVFIQGKGSDEAKFFTLSRTLQPEEGQSQGRAMLDPEKITERQLGIMKGDLINLVDRARTTFEVLALEGSASDELAAARCIAVFPNVTQAALIVGGSHGDGIVSCKNEAGQWSRVGFLDLLGASLGAQLGVQTTSVVMMFMTPEAERQLRAGDISLGAELSYALGDGGAFTEVKTDGADILVNSEPNGLFAGAALDGTLIKADNEELKTFYEQPIVHYDILTTWDFKHSSEALEQFLKTLGDGSRQSANTEESTS